MLILLGIVVLAVAPGAALAKVSLRGWNDEEGDVTPAEELLARAIVFGAATWVLGSEVLARVGLLTPEVVRGGGALLGLLSVGVLATHGRRSRTAGWRVAGGAVASALVAGVPHVVGALARPDSLISPTPWYYWGQARAIAVAGRVPAAVSEWGTRTGFLAEYLGFSSASASLWTFAGRPADLVVPQAIKCLAAVATFLSMWLLARGCGARTPAAMASVLLLAATQIFATKLSSFRPEAFAYPLTFLTPYFVLRFLRAGDRFQLALGALSFILVGQIHGVAWAFAACLAGGAIAAHVLTSELSLAQRLRRPILVGGGLALVLPISALLKGNLSSASALSGLPPTAVADPTWLFFRLATGNESLTPPNAVNITTSSLRFGFLGIRTPLGAFLAMAGAGCIWMALASRQGNARSRWLFTLLEMSVAMIVLASLVFALGWDTYVPQRTGLGRLLQLSIALMILAVTVPVSLLSGRLGRWVTAATVALAVCLFAATTSSTLRLRSNQPGQRDIARLKELRPLHGELVLANAYTEGYLAQVTGATPLLEGRAPYTQSDLLARANDLLQASRTFFAQPAANTDFLVKNAVEYILVAKGRTLASPRVFAVNEEELRQVPDIELVRTTPSFSLYRLRPVPAPAGGDLPNEKPEAVGHQGS